MKVLGKITKTAIMIVISAAVVLNILQLTVQVLHKQELSGLFGYSRLAVLTGSMEPAIAAGDLIIIRRETEYKKGDIITFREENSYTTHRIMEIKQNGVYTKGDANNTPDSKPVRFEQIVGRVILVIPSMGKVFLFLRTPAGLFLLLLAGGMALYAAERTGKKEKRCAE